MQKTTTLFKLRLFFGKVFPVFMFLALSVMKMNAQPYINGTLSTGTTAANGTVAPAGYTWSECQNPTGNTTIANTTAGVGAQVASNNSVADDFTIPGTEIWNISKITVYGYSTGYTGTASPYTDVRIRIHKGSPLAGPTTIVFGDLTTNRFTASSDAGVYRIFNTVVAPVSAPGTTRKVWKIEANITVALGPGVYWLEYRIGTSQASNFTPLSSPAGVRTLPGYNAIQSLAGGAWAAMVDGGQGPAAPSNVAVDLPFTVDYTASPCVGSSTAVLSQVTLPPVPATLISENFNTAIPLPAGWAQQNLSSPLGPQNWIQGNAANFPANSGAGNSYISALWSNTTTTGVGTISNWLFAPNVTLKNGDVFSFYTRTTNGTFPDRLQVRMSTNGASVNAGASNTSVGDFTVLLLDINPTYTSTGYPTAWTKFTITLSGLPAAGVSGRLAFRYFVENGGGAGANSDVIGIDDVLYTTVVPGAPPTTCTGSTANLKVDITGGLSPYTVTITPTAPAGAPIVVSNYVSGANIPVTPAVTTTYALTSVVSALGCTGTGNSGTPTVTVSPVTTTPLRIIDDPTGPLCAGNPKLLTVAPGQGSVTFTAPPANILIPGTGSGSSTAPAPASNYPINLSVSGLPASGVSVKSVTLMGLSHTWMSDVNILLQSPTGQNVVIMADCGRSGDLANHTLTFDDAAPLNLNNTLGGTDPPASGTTWKPTNLVDYLFPASDPDNWPAPGPGVFGSQLPLSTFTGDFNGTWKMFITDDGAGDVGSLNGGFNIVFNLPLASLPAGYTFQWSPAAGLSSTTTNPVAASPMQTTTYQVLATEPNGCQTTAQITINVNQLPAVTAQPGNTTVCAGATATFTATGSGAGITYQWQQSIDGGTNWNSLSNGGLYSGVTTTTLTVGPVTPAMNGYRYRIVVSGTCPPSANSLAGILTVNPLPVVTISPAGPVCGGVAGINATQLTASSPTGGNFTWSPATGLYTDATGGNAYIAGTPTATVYAAPGANTTYTVSATNPTTGCIGTGTVTVNYTPGAPVVTPASATICLGGIQQLSIAPLASTFNSGIVNIAIPDNTANGISHTIPVSGLTPGSINNIAVTLNITHTWVGDLVINLKAPNNSILALDKYLTATGGSAVTTGMTNTVISSQGVNPLSSGTNPWTATFKPDAINGTIAGPTVQNPAGFVSNATGFPDLYSQPNGNWTLAIADGGALDVGTLVSWSITLSYGAAPLGVWTPATGLYTDPGGSTPYIAGTPVQTVYASPAVSTTYAVTVANGTCTSPVRTVPVTVNTPLSISGQPANVATCTNGIATFTTVVSGTAPSHHWQVSSDNGNTWTNIANGGVYSGATTGTLTITNPLLTMNNYLYRDSVSTAPCGSIISAIATLTVNPLPVVTLSASPYTRLFPGLTTTISSSITPNAAATYTWRRNGVVVPGANGASLYVDADGLGLYTLTVNDVNGCGSSSNSILISDSVNTKLFIYPNPNTGRFQVRYYSVNANTLVRGLTVYNAAGQRVLVQQNSITAPYARMDVDMSKFGKGIYWVELGDQNGNRLAVGRVVIQ